MSADTDDPEGDAPGYAPHDPPLAVLDVVRDREDDEATDAVVVNTPPVAAKDWTAYADVSVADDNPEYDRDAEVIVVAFRAELHEARPEFTDTNNALQLGEADDVDTYAFPPGRLRRVASICPDDGEERHGSGAGADSEGDTPADPSRGEVVEEDGLRADLDAIAGAVEELNVDSVAVDTFREAVVVEKLGVEYLISADGSVDDDDRVGEALEEAAEAVVDG
jgi:hypothetical protein